MAKVVPVKTHSRQSLAGDNIAYCRKNQHHYVLKTRMRNKCNYIEKDWNN